MTLFFKTVNMVQDLYRVLLLPMYQGIKYCSYRGNVLTFGRTTKCWVGKGSPAWPTAEGVGAAAAAAS